MRGRCLWHQTGRRHIEDAIVELLQHNPQGLRNVQIADMLGLRSIHRGGQRNYLTYSVLGGLVEQGRISWDAESKLYTVLNADDTVRALAEEGLNQIEDAFLELLQSNAQGLRNVQIAEMLHLHSSVRGGRRNYLTYSVLGRLLADGRVVRHEKSRIYTRDSLNKPPWMRRMGMKPVPTEGLGSRLRGNDGLQASCSEVSWVIATESRAGPLMTFGPAQFQTL